MPVPQFDAKVAAGKALEKYDANDDGLLSVEELTECAALAEHLSRHDADGDGQMSQKELADRILSWTSQGTGVMRVLCRLTLDGKPLTNAKVFFKPVDFLGEANKPASGKSKAGGYCNMNIDPADLPPELSRIRGVQPGLYQIIITHDTIKLPSQYQEPSILTIEVAEDTISLAGYSINLKSRKP